MSGNSFEELIDYAIEREQEAAEFYAKLAGEVKELHVRETLLDFAEQERAHEARLKAVKAQGTPRAPSGRSTPDLRISDYLVQVQPTPDLTFQGALIIAMNREKAAFRLYQDLAAQCQDEELRAMFLFLAQQEASHKLSCELQYDELILREN